MHRRRGAAGMRLGWALVEPGPQTRAGALAAEARARSQLVLGTAPWLVVAGLVEGFVTPSGLGLGVVADRRLGLGVALLERSSSGGASARSEPSALLCAQVRPDAGRRRARRPAPRRRRRPRGRAGRRTRARAVQHVDRNHLAVDIERRRGLVLDASSARSGSTTLATVTACRRASTGNASSSGRAAASSMRSVNTSTNARFGRRRARTRGS